MPRYTKLLKELLTNKRKLKELLIVTLSKECSTTLQNKLPKKLKDPWSFTLPFLIGKLTIRKALVDLLPYNLFKKMGLREPKATRMSIHLADR